MNILTAQTLLHFQKLIDKVNSNNVFSASTYPSWSTFGVHINYEYDKELN